MIRFFFIYLLSKRFCVRFLLHIVPKPNSNLGSMQYLQWCEFSGSMYIYTHTYWGHSLKPWHFFFLPSNRESHERNQMAVKADVILKHIFCIQLLTVNVSIDHIRFKTMLTKKNASLNYYCLIFTWNSFLILTQHHRNLPKWHTNQ